MGLIALWESSRVALRTELLLTSKAQKLRMQGMGKAGTKDQTPEPHPALLISVRL